MYRLKKYEHTIYASYIGYITQAVVNNFAPLLFLTFAKDYGLTLDKITFITTINFAVQLIVDLLSSKFADKIGTRVCIVSAHIFSAVGLAGMAVLPEILPNAYAGLIISAVMYAIGGGLIEVLISPIVEACPTEKKEAAMSLLHSFYCWGHMGVVLISTAFFRLFGVGNWHILAIIWAAVPLLNGMYFMLVPLYDISSGEDIVPVRSMLRQPLFILILVIMICAGASEQAVSQWTSAFAESALNVSKTVGDLAGPCCFALFMGLARALYGKYSDRLPLNRFMLFSAVLCICCYLMISLSPSLLWGLVGCGVCGFSVGIFWPGTFSAAAKEFPRGGTSMYALMALAGDIGCSAGPTVAGLTANAAGGDLKTGIGAAIVFPAVILIGIVMLGRNKGNAHD
ncbi:MAG: MFS transporter [Oscillospiraceae bacterium]